MEEFISDHENFLTLQGLCEVVRQWERPGKWEDSYYLGRSLKCDEETSMEVCRRHQEIKNIIAALRLLAPELMPRVPIVDFWRQPYTKMTTLAQRMVGLESKILCKMKYKNEIEALDDRISRIEELLDVDE